MKEQVVMEEQKTPKTWVSEGITFTISEELNEKGGGVVVSRKLAEANKILEETKDSLPFNIDKTKK